MDTPQINRYLEEGFTFIPAVVVFAIEDDVVLLGLRKKVSEKLGQDVVAGIGGKVEEGESDEDALIRESKEEVDITPLEFELRGRINFIVPGKPKWSQSVAVYICTKWRGRPKETTVIKPEWYKKAKLPFANMWEDNAIWLPKVLAGETVNAVFLLDENERVVEYVFEQ